MKVQTYEEVFGHPLSVRDLVNGFDEDTKTGRVRAFGGKLNVRPAYQREFIYSITAQQAVIDTVMKGYPLNVMYWAKSAEGADSEYELMDGQQRTLSICKYCDMQQVYPVLEGKKIRNITFEELESEQKRDFLNYPLTVYICDGDEAEKLAWFRIINIAGIKLTEQEMRNAIYTSAWVTDAKRDFSTPNGPAYQSEGRITNGHTYGDYVDVTAGSTSEKEDAIVRQKLLEIALSWATDKYNRDNMLSGKAQISIDDYMQMHKKDADAKELWRYYEDVMEWVKATFPTYNTVMKGVDWGVLYNQYHDNTPADADMKANAILASSEEISNAKEAYHAALSDNMKWVNARKYSDTDKKWAFKKQNGICPYCHSKFDNFKQMHGDHIVPWSKGGKTERDNLQMLCAECNIKKSAYDTKYKPWDKRTYQSFEIDKWDNKTSNA